jgi:hypothetical protein
MAPLRIIRERSLRLGLSQLLGLYLYTKRGQSNFDKRTVEGEREKRPIAVRRFAPNLPVKIGGGSDQGRQQGGWYRALVVYTYVLHA